MNSTAVEPAKAPPPGLESNFVNPPSIQAVIIFALTLELFVSTVSAIIRCYSQWYLFKKLIWVDYCMLIGWAFQVAFVGLLYDCLPYGGGRHLWDVTKSDFAHISFLLFIDYILYGCAILGPKISILLQLIAIFVPRGRNLSTSSRLFFWAGWGLIAVNLVFYISHNFLLIFQCKPIRKGWDPSTPGTCLEQFSLIESSAPFNIVSDILIFILPLSSIWRLNLPVKTRVGIASAFAVGLFGVICSGIRLSYSDRLAKSGDITYLVFQNQAWANAEITAAILISNVIILPRFLRALRKGDSTQRYTHEKYTQNKYGQKSRAKSGGLRGEFDFQFGPHDRISESYIELGDRQSETINEDENSITKTEESSNQSGVGYAITRTVEIERTEEDIAFPEQVLSPGPHNQVITNVIGSARNT